MIWCIIFAWDTHTKSGTLSLQKIEAAQPPLNPPLHSKVLETAVDKNCFMHPLTNWAEIWNSDLW